MVHRVEEESARPIRVTQPFFITWKLFGSLPEGKGKRASNGAAGDTGVCAALRGAPRSPEKRATSGRLLTPERIADRVTVAF